MSSFFVSLFIDKPYFMSSFEFFMAIEKEWELNRTTRTIYLLMSCSEPLIVHTKKTLSFTIGFILSSHVLSLHRDNYHVSLDEIICEYLTG